jgi:hypothetical protein
MKVPANQVVTRFSGPVPFLLLAIFGTVLALPHSEAEDPNAPHHTPSNLSAPIRTLPLAFERYEDQFVSRTPGYTIAVQNRSIALRA